MKIFSLILILITVCLVFGLNIFASEDEFMYNSHNKRDPFVPMFEFDKGQESNAQQTTATEDSQGDNGYITIGLEGIVFDPNTGSRVIIDGQILKVGDEGDGFKVEQIFPDRVIVDVSGEKKVVKLREIEEETKGSEEDTIFFSSDKKEDSESNEEVDSESSEEVDSKSNEEE